MRYHSPSGSEVVRGSGLSVGVRAYLGREVALLQTDGLTAFCRLYQCGHLGENGKGKQHAYGCKHTAVNHSQRWAEESTHD